MNSKTICVMGLGYIGLPAAALLANSGYRVIGVEINQAAVDVINDGGVQIPVRTAGHCGAGSDRSG